MINFTININLIINIILGVILGFLYAQLFLYQKNYSTNSQLELKNNWQNFLIRTTSLSFVRILILLAIFALLLSWLKINFILVAILFLAVFWITILKNIKLV